MRSLLLDKAMDSDVDTVGLSEGHEANNSHQKITRSAAEVRNQETRSVRLLMAGHVESPNGDDGYVVSDLPAGQYDEAKVYAFAQQIDVRLPLGDSATFQLDIANLQSENNLSDIAYTLEEGMSAPKGKAYVTSGVDSRALLNDHVPPRLTTVYPVSLVADSTSKKHYYVAMLASDSSNENTAGDDPYLHEDSTIASGANQQSFTDFDESVVPGVVNINDFFGLKGRPKYGSAYRILLKKMAIENVDERCVKYDNLIVHGCENLTMAEKHLSSKSYDNETVAMPQTWMQEFTPSNEEDVRPSGLIFASGGDSTGAGDILVMAGSTSGMGAAFGTNNENLFGTEDAPQRFDLDGFVMKIRTDTGAFSGKDKFDPTTNSFTNQHSARISSLPNMNDVVASVCIQPERTIGTQDKVTHVYAVGSTEGVLPGIPNGVRNDDNTLLFPETDGHNSMEAFLMKIDLATMNTVWTVQVGATLPTTKKKGDAYGFGCAVTQDGEGVYMTGMVKDGGVVTDFSDDQSANSKNQANGGSDVFVASYQTLDGILNFLKQIGSTKDDTPARGNGGITTDRVGNAILIGNTRGSLMRNRDAAEFAYGQYGKEAASDVFVMSLAQFTGEYAAIADDSAAPVIPIDNSGSLDGNNGVLDNSIPIDTSSAAAQEPDPTPTQQSASIFLVVLSLLFIAGAVMTLTVVTYKVRSRRRKAKEKESYMNSNLNSRRRSTWGLHRSKGAGSVLANFDDMNIMVEVRTSASGGWHGIYDDEQMQAIDFGKSRGGGQQDDVIEQSLFMEDGLQGLEEIEESIHNDYSIGDVNDDEEVTDEDLIQAYNDAMAIDVEPESNDIAYVMPNFGSGGGVV
jgi:hypothetical protein